MALKKAENSDETIIRVVETTGKPVKDLRVGFTSPIISAREVNGQEQAIGDAKIVDGQLATDLSAYRLRTFAIKLAKSSARLKSPSSQPVDIAYDCSTATRDGEKSVEGFDSDSRCLSAEMLPDQITDGGVTFKLGPTGSGRKNALTCKGQTISLPKGKFNRVALLIAASSEDQPAVFEVDNKKVELIIQDWGGFIGQWDNRIWKAEPQQEWPYGYAGLVPGYIKREPVAWFCSHRHNADGENELYSYSYLYTYTIDMLDSSKTLKLPDNPNIRVMAISVVQDPTIDCRPAQPLYDTL
jgi:alpha-mannosidase